MAAATSDAGRRLRGGPTLFSTSVDIFVAYGMRGNAMTTTRLADVSDLHALSALLRSVLTTSPGAFAVTPEEFDSGLGVPAFGPSETWVVAEDGGVMVGCAALFTRPSSVLAHKADLRRVHVVPSHWGTGLAERLVHAVIASRPAHVRFVRASTSASNRAAQGLAQRVGFVPYAVEPASLVVDGRLVDEIWMQMDLAVYAPPTLPLSP